MVETLISNIQSAINERPLMVAVSIFLCAYTVYMFASNYIQRYQLMKKRAEIEKERLEIQGKIKELEASITKKKDEILERLKRRQ